VMKRLVDRGLARGASAGERAMAVEVLARIRNEPSATPEDRLWAIVRQTRRSLETGFPEDAVRRLLPEIQRLDSIGDPKAGELFVLLGRAYLELGRLDEARRRLMHAESIVPDTDLVAAAAQTLLARLDRLEGQLESARDRYAEVATRFPETPPSLEAWIGLGEAEAELGHFDESLAAFEQAVFLLTRGGPRDVDDVERADAAMAQRHRERFERGDHERALRYASLLESLYRGEETPPAVVVRLAETHRARAEQILESAPRNPAGEIDVFETDPATLEQAREHFARAGARFARHAQMTLLGAPDVSSDSLWRAADSHDRAGDVDRASDLFAEYVEVLREDERRLEGLFRLARAHQARGDYERAIELFASLMDDHPTSDVAYRSFVPLAQCYLLASADADEARAEQLLLRALSGDVFAPVAPEFRAALVELGEMYRRVGRHTEALGRLGEALERYPDLADSPQFIAELADAHRQAAGTISGELANAMPRAQRARLEALRIERLEDALGFYERARELLVSIPSARFGELHDVMLRNAMLYRGDCAFDLGEANARRPEAARSWYEQAIRHYDTAAQRYPQEPASLVAMIQIVNCYAALGKWREVRTAHERARARLEEIPQGAFEASGAPMGRGYWERWLDAAIELDRLADAGGGGAGP
jgi:tetratricopeptide (TPR) repeat protein